jgi:hypothetical protein
VAMVAMRNDGKLALGAIAASLLRHPRQVSGLIALAKASKEARAALLARLEKLPARTF